MHPLTNVEDVIGGLYEPQDGHIDPYGATHALAKGARQMGAEVRQNASLLELHQEDYGTWRIVTDQGEIAAEWIVNAAGLWANDVANNVGMVDVSVFAKYTVSGPDATAYLDHLMACDFPLETW